MDFYIPVPDNKNQFYSFVNLVINNRENNHKPEFDDRIPRRIGPYNVTYTNNEVGEKFIVVPDPKMKHFIEMIVDQFTLIRTYWPTICKYEEYPNSTKYDL